MDERHLLREFAEFLKANAEPPPALEQKLFLIIRGALNPSLGWTLSKIFLFHVLGSFLTLLFCPQYGIALISSLGVVPRFLMTIHPAVCFFGCGVIWMIGGQLLSYTFLTIDEQRILGAYRWGAAFTITLLSLLFFACLGTLVLDQWFAIWMFGALSAIIFFNWRVVRTLRHCGVRMGILI